MPARPRPAQIGGDTQQQEGCREPEPEDGEDERPRRGFGSVPGELAVGTATAAEGKEDEAPWAHPEAASPATHRGEAARSSRLLSRPRPGAPKCATAAHQTRARCLPSAVDARARLRGRAATAGPQARDAQYAHNSLETVRHMPRRSIWELAIRCGVLHRQWAKESGCGDAGTAVRRRPGRFSLAGNRSGAAGRAPAWPRYARPCTTLARADSGTAANMLTR